MGGISYKFVRTTLFMYSITYKVFTGNLMFRQREKWILEIDICLLSPQLLSSSTQSIEVAQDMNNPSDHAPVSVDFIFSSDLPHSQSLLHRAAHLDGHAVLLSESYLSPFCRKPIPCIHGRIEFMRSCPIQ